MRKGPEEGLILSRRSHQGRRLALAGALLVGVLIAASPAAGQTESTTTTTPTPGAPVGTETTPAISPNTATILPGGKASAPAGAPSTVVRAIKAANKIHRRTYIWGGGHRSF